MRLLSLSATSPKPTSKTPAPPLKAEILCRLKKDIGKRAKKAFCRAERKRRRSPTCRLELAAAARSPHLPHHVSICLLALSAGLPRRIHRVRLRITTGGAELIPRREKGAPASVGVRVGGRWWVGGGRLVGWLVGWLVVLPGRWFPFLSRAGPSLILEVILLVVQQEIVLEVVQQEIAYLEGQPGRGKPGA